jgi:DNA-binding CsgD family transcriptional regulator
MPDLLFDALCATLDHFDAGFVAVLPDGAILHANRTAREMISAGWPIQAHNGCLQACSKKATSLLLNSLRQLSESSESSPPDGICLDVCLADATSPKGGAIATMKPLVDAKLNPSPVSLFVTSLRSSRRDCVSSGVAECFGLTPAETRTLNRFLEGGTVAEAALALAVSENTVKTHLQNIFAKTRLSRQGQLIRLVNDFRPPLRPVRAGALGKAGRFSRQSCRSHTASVRL